MALRTDHLLGSNSLPWGPFGGPKTHRFAEREAGRAYQKLVLHCNTRSNQTTLDKRGSRKLKIRETGRRCFGPCPAERRPDARQVMAPGKWGVPVLTGASSGPGGQHRTNAPLRSTSRSPDRNVPPLRIGGPSHSEQVRQPDQCNRLLRHAGHFIRQPYQPNLCILRLVVGNRHL